MEYNFKAPPNSIEDVIRAIGRSEMFLPAIQREFVWGPEKIEDLFNSVMKENPIGVFYFWHLTKGQARDYVFYKFLESYDYSAPIRERNKRHEGEFSQDIIGVLDGQQRITSLYFGLKGSVIVKETKKHLYLNLFKLPYEDKKDKDGNFIIKSKGNFDNEKDEDGNLIIESKGNFEFKFLDEEKAKEQSDKELWYRVSKIRGFEDSDSVVNELKDKIKRENIKHIFLGEKEKIKQAIERLRYQTYKHEHIYSFPFKGHNVVDALDVFEKLNRGGTPLSPDDLLFSTIVASWPEGREEIPKLEDEINKKGFGIKVAFIMRSCLVLLNIGVRAKLEFLKFENVMLIKNNWKDISNALKRTFTLIESFGFGKHPLTSLLSVIPIAHHFMKGGEENKEDIHKYLLHVLLRGIASVGSSATQVLEKTRTKIQEKSKESKSFPVEELLDIDFGTGAKLRVLPEDIPNLIDRKGKGVFAVLALLYQSKLNGAQPTHIDHLHPQKSFTPANLKKIGVSDDDIKEWRDKKDKVSNLQLLTAEENLKKGKMSCDEWSKDMEKDPNLWKNEYYLPVRASYEFKDFLKFYDKRKELIEEALKEKLK